MSREYLKLVEQTLMETKEPIVTIKIDGYPWYIQKIDSTHLNMSSSKKFSGMTVRHIGELKGEKYYNDILAWLQGKKKLTNAKY